MKRRWVLALASTSALGCASLGCASQALAWGGTGHRWIGRAAIEALPADLPPFLHTAAARDAVGELSREPDRSRGAGKAHDSDHDPGHFVDGDDDGRLAGGPSLTALPATREDYETALRAVGATSWKIGYLPYSIIEDWQQLKKDFAYWRADDAGARQTSDPAHKAWLEADRAERERQIMIDIGALSHFVGDGSMPLHVSIHFNGWGPFPNPTATRPARCTRRGRGPMCARTSPIRPCSPESAPSKTAPVRSTSESAGTSRPPWGP